MTADEILAGLGTRLLGRTIHAYAALGSTNDTAARLAEAGAPEGTLVTTEQQTRGRGRLGRTWNAPPGSNLTVSLILRPPMLIADLGLLPPLVALGLVRGLEQVAPALAGRLQTKWPNDVLTVGSPGEPGRKLSGVLCESSLDGSRVRWVIVGIGLNVNARPPEAPGATSLAEQIGYALDRPTVLRALLSGLEAIYLRYRSGERASLVAEWQRAAPMIGSRIVYRTGDATESAVALGLDTGGRLVVRRERDGVTLPLSAADVTLGSGSI